MNKNTYFGKLGENIAKNYLIKNGYTISALNYRIGYYEIDIIAKYDHYLVFIEVKTRLSTTFGLAEDQLIRNKANKIRRAINRFFSTYGFPEIQIKADFIAINLKISKKMANIKHFKNIL